MTFPAGEPKKVEHDYWYSVQFKVMATYTARNKFGNFALSKRDLETLDYALRNHLIGGLLKDAIDNEAAVFVHPLFANVYFPRRKIAETTYACNTPLFHVRIGSVSELPYGGYARLVFLDLLRRARIQQTPEINLGLSLYEYVRELGLHDNGRIVNQIKDNLFRLADTSFSLRSYRPETHPLSKTLGTTEDQVNFYICKNRSFWRDDHSEKIRQHYWKREITLTDEMFKLACKGGFPSDIRIFSRLVKSTLAFDLMLWLPWRIALLNRTHDKFVKIPLVQLKEQFYPSMPNLDQNEFKRKLKDNANLLFHLYPDLDKSLGFDDKGTSLILQNKHVKFLK